MRQYAIRRIILAIPTLFGVSILLFLFVRALPGDIVDSILQEEAGYATPEVRAELERQYGIGEPAVVQYLRWVSKVARGDLGISPLRNRAVADDIQARLPASFELAFFAAIIGAAIAIPLGIIAAVHRNAWPDYVARVCAAGINAMPIFWVSTLLLVIGSIRWSWSPPLTYVPLWDDPVANLKFIAIPTVLLGVNLAGTTLRVVRSEMLEVLRQDYTRTARAKGLANHVVLIRHALRNVLIPIVTIVGLQVPLLLSGSVILESIFVIPGMGTYLIQSVNLRDYTAVQSTALVFAVGVIAANIIVDISYSALDPRIRLA